MYVPIPAALLAAVTALATLPLPATAYHDDCASQTQSAPQWRVTTGIDYDSTWEDSFGQAPSSSIGATVTTTCKIVDHEIPNGELCPLGQCVKFWAQLQHIPNPNDPDPGDLASRFCSDLIINGAPTTKRQTPVTDGVLCEYYCSNVYVQCGLNQVVTVSIGLTLAYWWEADDAPGSERWTTFEAINRLGTHYYQSHRTCQATNPAAQLLLGPCGVPLDAPHDA